MNTFILQDADIYLTNFAQRRHNIGDEIAAKMARGGAWIMKSLAAMGEIEKQEAQWIDARKKAARDALIIACFELDEALGLMLDDDEKIV